MSTINEFPWRETILRSLRGGPSASVSDITATIHAGEAAAARLPRARLRHTANPARSVEWSASREPSR